MAQVSALRLLIDARGAAAGAAAFSRATGQVKASAISATSATQGMVAAMKPMLAMVGIGATIKTLADFEEKMRLAGLVAGATGETLKAMTDRARELGATTRFTGAQAAEGMLELSRAGFDASESMLMIADSLALATAGGLELGEATGFMSNSIRQFGLDASEAARVASTFVSVSNNANTDVRQLAEAMKYAGTVASAIGADVETAAAAIGVLGDRGVQGSMAGTQLRGTLLALASPTDKAAAALGRLGLEMDDVNPATSNLVEISKKLKGGINALENPMEAAGIFSDIFGRRNAAAALAMADANEKMEEQIALAKSSASAHSELAAEMEKTLIGKFKALSSAVQEVMLDAGDSGLTTVLKKLMDTITQSFRIIGGIEGAFAQATKAAKALTSAITVLTLRFVILRAAFVLSAMYAFIAGAVSLAIAAAQAAVAVGGLTGALLALEILMKATTIGIVAGALAALATAFWMTKGAADDEAAAATRVAEAHLKLAKDTREASEAIEAMGAAFDSSSRSATMREAKTRLEQLRKLQIELTDGADSAVPRSDLLFSEVASELPSIDSASFEDVLGGIDVTPFESQLIDTTSAMEAVQEEIDALKELLKSLDPFYKAQEEGNKSVVASLEDWQAAEGALLKDLQVFGETAAETALIQEALSVARKLAADSTEKLGSAEVATIYDTLKARRDAKVELAAQAQGERDAAEAAEEATKRATDAFKAWIKERRKANKAAADAAKSNADYLQTLENTVAVMRLRKAGDEEGAIVMQANNLLLARNIDLTSEYAESVRALMLEQSRLSQLDEEGAVKLDERAQSVQRFTLQSKEQMAQLEMLMPLQGLHADAYDRAAAKAQVAAEAKALLVGASQEEALAIVLAREEMISYIDTMADVDAQLQLTQGIQSAFGDMFIDIIDGSASAADAFEAFGKRVMAMIMDMIVRKALMDALFGGGGLLSGIMPGGGTPAIGGGGGGTVNGDALLSRGGAFDGGGRMYAGGGVVNRTSRFMSADGQMNTVGEAGAPEAIVPLKKDRRGNLGVSMSGEGGGNKTTIVNMKVVTPDADSFRRSRIQIQNDMKRATTQLEK